MTESLVVVAALHDYHVLDINVPLQFELELVEVIRVDILAQVYIKVEFSIFL